MITKVSFLVLPKFLQYNQGEKEHQFVMSLFPELEDKTPRESLKILYRTEFLNSDSPYILIQSTIEPKIENLKNQKLSEIIQLQTKDETEVYNSLLNESHISYKIRVNPVITSNKKRIPVRGQNNIQDWWDNKAKAIGLDTIPNKTAILVEKPKSFKNVLLSSAEISGIAKVEDKTLIQNSILNGIGREKSYGYGLLLIGKS